ncbi:MAG: hypothetical protein QM778_37885 [Myxococcales bacterium]
MRFGGTRVLLLGAITWVLAACLSSTSAQAQPLVHGAVDGRALIETSGRYGGAITADLWWGKALLKAGLAAGVGAVSNRRDASSRVFTPLGLSLSLAPKAPDTSGPLATLRLGFAPGAQKGGFVVAGWASCALGYRFSLGEGASLRLGADAWFLIGKQGGVFFGPFLGLGF